MSNIIKIGIDASRSVDSIQKTGVEKVSDELLREIRNQKSEIRDAEIIYYTPQKISWLPKESQRILRWPLKFFWTQIRLGWELLIHPPKVFFSPVYVLPFVTIFTRYTLRVTRYYKTIHDIAFKRHPELYTWWQKFNLNLDLWLAQKLCTKIFVPTEAVKNDLLKYTKISADKIIVIHHGYRPECHSERSEESHNEILRPSASSGLRMTPTKKQILYIGRVEEKKNIINLIKAFEIFNQKHPDYKLILAGKVDPNFNIQYSILNIKNKVEPIGYITEEKKCELLQQSTCLILVSKEEGFGFPILEGFDFGLPVLASDIPVLREVGGDACLYINPDSVEEIAIGLEKIISDENLRQNLIEQGRERLKEFRWEQAADSYIRTIRNS
ncbi:MAG: glycosyltransferase family 1 protein [Patescibacteria group bacterium]|nr:glycosyltransferase family 1 protein [Patescibacteria group bacterium]